MHRPVTNLKQFLDILRKEKELIEIDVEVDANLEIAEIHRRIAAVDGPALLFKRVKNSSFPVVTNLFGSNKRIAHAFPHEPEKIVRNLLTLITEDFPPKFSTLWQKRNSLKAMRWLGTKNLRQAPVCQHEMPTVDLEQIPLLKLWPLDGGHFVTLPLVYTQSPLGGPPNLAMYRIQRFDKTTTGIHWQIAKGGGFHYSQAESQNQSLPVSIFVGGPPALIMSAIAPLPENVCELLLAGFLQGKKLSTTKLNDYPHPLISECEFALLGEVKPFERRLEGPFGDHYGYYSWAHDFPVFHCNRVFHQKDAIYPATVVGKPRQEDFYIGDFLQDLLSPLFPIVMPGVKALWSYGETGFHSLTAAVVRERYYRECMASAFRILGEGQLSLTKFLLVTDQPVDVKDIKQVLPCILERFNAETDLFIFTNLSLDTLDYTGPELNKGSRGIMLGIGEKKRDLPHSFQGSLPQPAKTVAAFCPGCLVIEVASYTEWQDFTPFLHHADFKNWPLIIIVDDLKKSLKNTATFLWTVFTRFEPAADIYSAKQDIHRHHIVYANPIMIDARMKPRYPPEVACDEKTDQLVSQRWSHYFPKGQDMGSSYQGHVC
ncbi:MAG: UbiD family decarboxylase [Parachlamydiales bacterium]|nr:UbiD family decarboxylase [Parachlamydiales bacterium]